MGETTNNETKKQSAKQAQPPKQSKLKALKNEFRKIIWPSKSDVTRQSIVVIVITVILAALISLIDMIINSGLFRLLNI